MVGKLIKSLPVMLALVSLMPGKAIAQAVEKKQSDGPEMTFGETTHNFGLFDKEHGVQTCYFVYENTGKKNLQILSVMGSCGCTVPTYTKTEILPGAKDSIKVTYDGTDKRPGVFRKYVVVKTNGTPETAYLYITGEMVEKLVPGRPTDIEEIKQLGTTK